MRGRNFLQILLVFCCVPLFAQYTTADLGGIVVDSSGAAVPDAKVTVRSIDTGFTQDTTSSASGAKPKRSWRRLLTAASANAPASPPSRWR